MYTAWGRLFNSHYRRCVNLWQIYGISQRRRHRIGTILSTRANLGDTIISRRLSARLYRVMVKAREGQRHGSSDSANCHCKALRGTRTRMVARTQKSRHASRSDTRFDTRFGGRGARDKRKFPSSQHPCSPYGNTDDKISRNKYILFPDSTSNFVRSHRPTDRSIDRSILPIPSYFGNLTERNRVWLSRSSSEYKR